MKKRFIAALLLVVMCMGAFSACSLTGKLEKDVQVYLETSDGLLGPYTVNAFNNAIVPAQEAPRGKKQLGWTDDKNWNEKDIKNVSVSENVGLIRYDDVKNYAKKGKVTLYPVFGEITRHDIAIAWYAKSGTSGLNQSVMDDFTDALKAYLTEQGMNPAEMDIVVRGYDGNVGTSCGNIMKDSDIDIMVGWAARSNIEGTGGLKAGEDFLQNYGNITLKGAENNKARYAARLGDTDLVKQVYNWILTTYGGTGAKKDYDVADTPVDPDPSEPDTPVEKADFVVSIWNNTKGEWIKTEQIESLKTAFTAYLAEKGVDTAKLKIEWRVEEDVTNVAALVKSVNDKGDVDFVLACGKNVNSDGNLTNLEKVQINETPYMTAGRYIAVLNKDNPNQYAKMLYEFMSGKKFPITLTDTTLTVSVWNNTKGEWITTEQLESLKTAFTAYLADLGVDTTALTIVWRVEEAVTNVAALVNSVNTAGDVDFVLACGKNVNSEGNLTNLEKIQINETPYMTAGRYIAVLNKDNPNQLAELLYEFMTGKTFPSLAEGGAQ
ncbi:MAG TPA: hypothetical protein DHU65_04885 [Clostridiales bacterium]|nr:hypothetical protein [Clostridiales bacterium]